MPYRHSRRAVVVSRFAAVNAGNRRLIASLDNEIYVSLAAIWEIEVKRRNGKLDCPPDTMERIKADRFKILPVTAEHHVPLRTIQPIHNDPFDRINGVPVHGRGYSADILRQ